MLISDNATTNTVESLNCASVATGGNLPVELEVNYREDMGHDLIIINSLYDIPYSYRKKKEKKQDFEISHPPEKRKEGIEICHSVDVQALEGFISDLKVSTLKEIQEFAKDDLKDKDYVSDSSQEVVSPPQKKREKAILKKKKPVSTPKRKVPNKRNQSSESSEITPAAITTSTTPAKISLSRQLRMVQEDTFNGSPLERRSRAGRFSLDGLINQ